MVLGYVLVGALALSAVAILWQRRDVVIVHPQTAGALAVVLVLALLGRLLPPTAALGLKLATVQHRPHAIVLAFAKLVLAFTTSLGAWLVVLVGDYLFLRAGKIEPLLASMPVASPPAPATAENATGPAGA